MKATPELEHLEQNEHAIRLEKVEQMRQQGTEPWPAMRSVSHTSAQARALLAQGDQAAANITLAGRILTKRDHGKSFFVTVLDRSGTLQWYLKKDDVGEQAFEWFKHFIDVGDIVWAKGFMFTTKMGESTLHMQEYALLSKCLHPLPEKFHGLTDIEQRYRQRYLDIISNPESREKFVKRSQIVKAVRTFLTDLDFMEVETPMLHPIPGGAAARPFVTHHNAYDIDLYLRIAPELYLKRLVVGGFERVFEINRNFRNEGVSTRHNPEFTMLEFYMAHQDYRMGMELVENLIRFCAQQINTPLVQTWNGHQIDLGRPFRRLTLYESLIEIGGLQPEQLTPETVGKTLQDFGITLHQGASHAAALFALFEHCVESKIVQPTFIMQYPAEISPLAKEDPEHPGYAARFELFIGGMEFANSYTELNDPFIQAERFREQASQRASGDAEAHHYDADFVKALEFGLPPTVGVGIGIDRLVMLLTGTSAIKDVILFPTLKPTQE